MAGVTKSQFDSLIDRHFQYEAEDDVDGVLSTLVDDLTHDLVGWPDGASCDKQTARALYRDFARTALAFMPGMDSAEAEGFQCI